MRKFSLGKEANVHSKCIIANAIFSLKGCYSIFRTVEKPREVYTFALVWSKRQRIKQEDGE